jgi:hypothetical protein
MQHRRLSTNTKKRMTSVQNFFHKDLELIYVEWVDTIGDPDSGWKNEEDSEEFFEREDNIVRETGFVFSEDKDYLYLIGKYMPGRENNLSAHRTKIPKRWILRRTTFSYKPTKIKSK